MTNSATLRPLVIWLVRAAFLFLPAAFLCAAEPLEAIYSQEPISVDASLSDPIWQRAPRYPLKPMPPKEGEKSVLHEKGYVQFAWDDQYLHLAATLEDLDIVAESDKDNEHHYKMGDVIELFLKSASEPCYWELYGTPRGHRTVFFFPSRGRVFLPSATDFPMDMKVDVRMDGTLNNWRDKDKGWTVQLSVPLDTLRKEGGPLGPDAPPWSALVGRYNYSVYHNVLGGELSSTSDLSLVNFHRQEEWRPLQLIRK